MSEPKPILANEAKIKKGTEYVGLAQSVALTLEADIIKAYRIGSDKPVIVASGNKSYRVSIDTMFFSGQYMEDLKNGTKFNLEIAPKGEGQGNPKIVVKNVVFSRSGLTIDVGDIIMQRVEGEGDDIEIGTYS